MPPDPTIGAMKPRLPARPCPWVEPLRDYGLSAALTGQLTSAWPRRCRLRLRSMSVDNLARAQWATLPTTEPGSPRLSRGHLRVQQQRTIAAQLGSTHPKHLTIHRTGGPPTPGGSVVWTCRFRVKTIKVNVHVTEREIFRSGQYRRMEPNREVEGSVNFVGRVVSVSNAEPQYKCSLKCAEESE